MARMNAKICIFLILTLFQAGWLSAAPLAVNPGDFEGSRFESMFSTRCYLFDRIELTLSRSASEKLAKLEKENLTNEKPAAISKPQIAKAFAANKANAIKSDMTCPAEQNIASQENNEAAENIETQVSESKLANVLWTNVTSAIQWQTDSIYHYTDLATEISNKVVTTASERSLNAIKSQLSKVDLLATQTISDLNNNSIFSQSVLDGGDTKAVGSKNIPTINVSHRKLVKPPVEIVEPPKDNSTESAAVEGVIVEPGDVEPENVEGFDGMPIEIKHERQDPYWQYYEDCDRWGVEFSLLLRDANLTNPNEALQVSCTKDIEQQDVASWIESSVDSIFAKDIVAAKKADLFIDNAKADEKFEARSFSVTGLLSSQNVLVFAYTTPRLIRLATESLEDSLKTVEFFLVESRDIDFESMMIQPLHPAKMVKYGFIPASKWIATWDSSEAFRLGQQIYNQLSPASNKTNNEVKSKEEKFNDSFRNSMADQVDSISSALNWLADSIRAVDSRGAIANRGKTTVTK